MTRYAQCRALDIEAVVPIHDVAGDSDVLVILARSDEKGHPRVLPRDVLQEDVKEDLERLSSWRIVVVLCEGLVVLGAGRVLVAAGTVLWTDVDNAYPDAVVLHVVMVMVVVVLMRMFTTLCDLDLGSS
jgi:hypothetical protein